MGDAKLQLQACGNCHGPAGIGQYPSYPYFAGQHAAYISAALNFWKEGLRNTDPSGQMPAIARKLSQSDIAALSAYYSRLAVPSGAMLQNSAAANVMPAGKSPPSTKNANTPGAGAQGVGTEQGSPLTSGNQGQGAQGKCAVPRTPTAL